MLYVYTHIMWIHMIVSQHARSRTTSTAATCHLLPATYQGLRTHFVLRTTYYVLPTMYYAHAT